MTTKNTYQSFNSEKSIEELKYNMLHYKNRLETIDPEFTFYEFIINSCDFKSQIPNLFEHLESFKKQITQMKKTAETLLEALDSYLHKINYKMECEDLVCDTFFIEIHNKIELDIYNLTKKATDFKLDMYDYLRSTLKHK